MSGGRERTFAEALNTWVQIIGIIVAAAWGGYTFIYKEIEVPKSAPINISMNLQLKKVSKGDVKQPLVAIEMHVSATNPSSRKVYLLPSVWMVFGYKNTPSKGVLDSFNQEEAAAHINARDGEYILRHSKLASIVMVGAGSLFSDDSLNPSETVERTLIFYVPRNTYDSVEADTIIPTTELKSGVELQWKLNGTGVVPTIYLISTNGERKPVELDTANKQGGLQEAESSSQLSLW
jgi:hypothetical protein